MPYVPPAYCMSSDTNVSAVGHHLLQNFRRQRSNKWKKHSERCKHCTRAGCSKVRTPPAHPPASNKHSDRTDYNTLRG